jgi:hypothetical protein
MKKVFISAIALLIISCSNRTDFKEIEISFSPAFMYPTKFTIDLENNIITQYQFQSSYSYEEEDTTDRDEKYGFKLHKVIFKDTLIVHYKKSFHINDNTLDSFLKIINEIKIDSNVVHDRDDVLDGISFSFMTTSCNNDTFSLMSNCPDRTSRYKLDYTILDAFFKLAYATINDYDGMCKVENIQNYFSYGLPVKLASKEPLEYRVWGTISGCRNDNQELQKFLNDLPVEKPVIFDLRNGKFAPCLYELFDEFSNKKSIYYYGKETIESEWSKIKLKNVFKTREQVLNNIANSMNFH